MRLALILALVLASTRFAFAAPGDDTPPPAADTAAPLARLELRGPLQQAPDAGRVASGFAVRVRDLTIHLAFTGPRNATADLKDAVGKTVLVSGSFEKRRGPTGQVLDVCVVQDGDLIVAGARYLVGYTDDADADALTALARDQSLKVADNYRPGKYLVVEATTATDAAALHRLKRSPKVRYVEPDAPRRIQD